jgi:hypothetical protein
MVCGLGWEVSLRASAHIGAFFCVSVTISVILCVLFFCVPVSYIQLQKRHAAACFTTHSSCVLTDLLVRQLVQLVFWLSFFFSLPRDSLLCPVSERLGFEEIVKHPFFEGIDWENIRSQRAEIIPVVVSAQTFAVLILPWPCVLVMCDVCVFFSFLCSFAFLCALHIPFCVSLHCCVVCLLLSVVQRTPNSAPVCSLAALAPLIIWCRIRQRIRGTSQRTRSLLFRARQIRTRMREVDQRA